MADGKLALLAGYPVTKAPPSLRYNNLHTTHKDSCVVYASGSSVARLSLTAGVPPSELPYNESVRNVHAVPPLQLEGAISAHCPLYVSTGATFVDVFARGLVVSSLPLTGNLECLGGGTCSAITVVGGTQSVTVVTGTANGCVLFVDVDLATASRGNALKPSSAPVDAHEKKTVTAVDIRYVAENTARTGALAVTGDATGRAVLWNYDRQPYVIIPVQGEDCVTSAKICNERNLVVALAYGSGKIQLHSATSGVLETSVSAHSRWINALSYTALRGGLLASCAEDSIVSVWTLPSANAVTEAEAKSNAEGVIEIHHVGSVDMENWLPTGVAFAVDAASVIVACYDNPTLRSYVIP